MFKEDIIDCQDCPAFKDSLFHSIPHKDLERVNTCKVPQTYSKGDIIFKMDGESKYYHCIMKGSVQLYRHSANREQSFAIVGQGTWIGYRDALAGIPYQHNARCLGPMTACRVEREILDDFIKQFPSFTTAVLKDVADGWIESERQSYNLGARKTIERLADFLLGLKRDSLKPEELEGEFDEESESATGYPEAMAPEGSDSGIVEVEFPLTRETVASLIGTTTESVIRTLSDFKARGWIEFANGKIRIINEKELIRLVSES